MKKYMSNYLMLTVTGIFCLSLTGGCGPRTPKEREGDEAVLRGTISVSGAFALYPLATKWAEEFQKLHPKVRIDISAGGAGKGMTDALSGIVDLGMFSRDILQAEIDKGCWWVAVAKDAVLPTINDENPWLGDLLERGITKTAFQKVFLEEGPVSWSEIISKPGLPNINVYIRSDACGAAQMWGEYLGKDQESLYGIGVFGDPGLAHAVKKDIHGLGFNNLNYLYDMNTRLFYQKIRVVPIDLNENGIIDAEENFYTTLDDVMQAIRSGIYPSPPARALFFVSKGKPQKKITIEFLQWILTEGQQFVHEAGYVELMDERIENELNKIGH
jgi:phosphate transport system substrate-binding protein